MSDKVYYIQTGYVGNSILWWGKNSSGYTTEIDKAGKFTHDEAMRIIERPQDKAWLCEHVDNCVKARKTIIDGQYLNTDFRIDKTDRDNDERR